MDYLDSSKHCWYTVNSFPKTVFLDASTINYYLGPEKSWVWTVNDGSIFNPEIHEWFNARGLKFIRAMVFYRQKAEDQVTPHVDFEGYNRDRSIFFSTSGLNIELQGKGIMEWFDIGIDNGVLSYADSGQPYFHFPPVDPLTAIDSTIFTENTPILIRSDVVHQVRCTEAPRLLISFKFRTINDIQLSWDETVKLLSNVLVAR